MAAFMVPDDLMSAGILAAAVQLLADPPLEPAAVVAEPATVVAVDVALRTAARRERDERADGRTGQRQPGDGVRGCTPT